MGLPEKLPENQSEMLAEKHEEMLPEVLLKHSKGEKHQKFLRIKPGRQLFVIGSSREADLRISGEGIQGCHAALRFRSPDWYVCDISGAGSGAEGLKVNGSVISEAKVEGSLSVEISGHKIQLFAKERENKLFLPEEIKGKSKFSLHQVVVRCRGRVVETKLLQPNESYVYYDGDKLIQLPAPKDGKWVESDVGSRRIQQRLVESQEILAVEKLKFDRDMRKALILAMLLFVFLVSTVFMLGSSVEKKPEVVLDKKSMDIIYNAKVIKKKKTEALKVVKAAKAKAGGTSEQAPNSLAKSSAPDESMAPKAVEKPSAALTSLRQSGLANLVGKIAKRANKQGVLVAAQGVSPDNKAGRAFYSTGTSTEGGGGSAAKEGPTFRLGGVGTKGRAGGVGNFKDGTALAGGNVGNGDLVAMVDEETVIEGGLDRDAIAEVIRRNLGQIRYCYERQLSSSPELYGKMLVKFTIAANGEVNEPKVDNSTLKSAMVEGCVMRRLASWKFPEPKGGTLVRVSYPFLFKAN